MESIKDDIILIKEDGVVTINEATPELYSIFETKGEGYKHLCWENCENAATCRCERMVKGLELTIDKYDTIISGQQLMNSDGNIERFLVSKCKNYAVAPRRKMTVAELSRIRAAKDALKINYFDTETIEEAHILQHELEKRGEIENIRGKKFTDEEIEEIEKRLKRKSKRKS